MPDDDRLETILAQWYERRDRGEDTSPEDVLREHPDLVEPLRARFRAERLLDEAFGDALDLPAGAPSRIGDFRILRELGRGGMGVVYEAEQTSMVRRVALKVLTPAITGTAHAVRRFQREAQAAGRLHHTNIVPIHAMGQHAGYWYYAMELVEGRPLSDVIAQLRRAARPTEEDLGRAAGGGAPRPSTRIEELDTDTGDRSYFVRVAETFADVADALQLAHVDGIVHRDIKPSNLLLDADGTLKIVDFGLARVDEVGGPSMTLTGDLLGTPIYMSPEQAMAKRMAIDHRTDIYSLGATLYEVLTLRPPFQGESLQEICSQIITKDPVLPRRRNHRVPRDLETIVCKAMEKDRGKRYASADELARDLRRFAEGGAIRARRIGALGRSWRRIKRHKVRSSLVAAVLLVGLVGGLQWRRATRAEALRRAGEYEKLVQQAEALLGSRGGLRRSLRRDDGAHELLDAAIQLVPDRPDAYWLRSLDANRTLASRLADLDAALARGFPQSCYHFIRARCLLAEGDATGAEKEALLANAHRTGDALEFYFEARLRLRLGERSKARELFSRAVAGAGPGTLSHGRALYERGRLHFADGAYENALEDMAQLKGRPDARIWIAAAWRRLEKEKFAETEFAEILRDGGDRWMWWVACLACQGADEPDWFERASAAALEEHAGDAILLSLRAKALVAVGRAEEAIAYCDRALATAPDRHFVHSAHGLVLRNLERYEDALRASEKAIQADPACGCGHEQRGFALGQLGRSEEALDAYGHALRLNAGNAIVHAGRANVLAGMGRFDDALAAYEEAVQVDPGAALHDRGVLLQRLRRFPEALADLERALQFVSPGSPEVVGIHANRAVVLNCMGQSEKALAAAEQALRLDRQCGLAHSAGGDALLCLGRFVQATPHLREATRLLPADIPSRINLAIALMNSGQPNDALAMLATALELHRSDPTAPPHPPILIHLHRGTALLMLGKADDALAALHRALDLCREAPAGCPPGALAQVHYYRGRAFATKGDTEQALAAWDRAAELGLQNPMMFNDMAWLLATNAGGGGDPRRAVELARRAVELAPRARTIRNTLGVALYRAGKLEKSVELLENTGSDTAYDWFFVAMAKHKLGQAGARLWYDKAVAWMDQHRPDDTQLNRFRAEAEAVLGIAKD